MKAKVSILLIFFLLPTAISRSVSTAYSTALNVYPVKAMLQQNIEFKRPGQLPHSRIAHGLRDVKAAWLAMPTERYHHGVLGDNLEAASLVIETHDNQQLQVDLPMTRVFEDLEPRLADLNRDGRDEILVVESDLSLGAALAIYHIAGKKLVQLSMTPFLGQKNRWLNPLGTGDFDGDGNTEIAVVATPHIGGKLRLYRLSGSRLEMFAEYDGVSTHKMGSTELGLGRVIKGTSRDRILIPDQSRLSFILLEWRQTGWNELTRVILKSAINSSLIDAGNGRWQFMAENGNRYEVSLKQQ